MWLLKERGLLGPGKLSPADIALIEEMMRSTDVEAFIAAHEARVRKAAAKGFGQGAAGGAVGVVAGAAEAFVPGASGVIIEAGAALGADRDSMETGAAFGEAGTTILQVAATGGLALAKEGGEQLVRETGEQVLKRTDNVAANQTDEVVDAVVPDNPSTYSVFSEQTVSGTTRQSHRSAANRQLYQQLDRDTGLRSMYDEALGTDVMAHMRRGKSGLLNPPGAVWHHPFDSPGVTQLMMRGQHTAPAFQPLLHPGGIGGFARWWR